MNALAWLGASWTLPWQDGTLEMLRPWVVLLAPLPLWLCSRWAPFATAVEALHVPFFSTIAESLRLRPGGRAVVLRRGWGERVCGVLAWLALVLAASGPEWVAPPQQRIVPARDMLLVLDLSESMSTRDMPGAAGQPVERLAAAREAIGEFIARRPGDRLGLVVFGERAHLLVPFTLDHALLDDELARLQAGMAGPRTMIGDAIGLGIKAFEASRAPAKVMVLLSDGADTGSRVPPEVAARLAQGRHITIHSIGLGRPGNHQDRVDVAMLAKLADTTGGLHALAGRLDELRAVYARVDALEPQNHQVLRHRARRSLFHWPLGAALFTFLLGQGLAAFVERRPGPAVAAGKVPSHA